MKTNILAQPRILKNNQIINCDENVLRRLPVQKPIAFLEEQWIFVYESHNEQIANNVFSTMQMASKQLGIKIQDPYWIYPDSEQHTDQLEEWLLEYMCGGEKGKRFRMPTIVVVLLSREKNYAEHKLIFDKYQMPS